MLNYLDSGCTWMHRNKREGEEVRNYRAQVTGLGGTCGLEIAKSGEYLSAGPELTGMGVAAWSGNVRLSSSTCSGSSCRGLSL